MVPQDLHSMSVMALPSSPFISHSWVAYLDSPPSPLLRCRLGASFWHRATSSTIRLPPSYHIRQGLSRTLFSGGGGVLLSPVWFRGTNLPSFFTPSSFPAASRSQPEPTGTTPSSRSTASQRDRGRLRQPRQRLHPGNRKRSHSPSRPLPHRNFGHGTDRR